MKNIEIHIDFACPFSYIGGERMIQYLEENKAPLTNIRFRSFQLNPDDDNTKPSYINNRFKASNFNTIDEYRDFFNNGIGRAAKSIGLNYDVDAVISRNSRHAHMGLQYATLFGKQAEYFREVMSGHFEQGKDFYDFEYIDGVLKKLGLDVSDFHSRESEMENLVDEDIRLAYKRSVPSVPTFYQDHIVLAGTGSYEEFDSFMK
ncbi:DsbA family oxidoreductase [Peptostreptococcus faecalis]|uniref:DsbA family oxidoreductase n=1 Tax=Peptostreptococcus faecalis TaxID=2045015 RepID=UPI000C7B57ED|nr:DsbA family protein [Peptostreptococcus faecalis]